jgi:hypothetical protein
MCITFDNYSFPIGPTLYFWHPSVFMREEFEVAIDGVTYLFKRMYHEDLDLTYHIHFMHDQKLMIFRMGLFADEWEIISQKLPVYIHHAKPELEKAIRMNESD